MSGCAGSSTRWFVNSGAGERPERRGRPGFSLAEVSVAALLAVLVLLGAFSVNHWTATTIDSSQRKISSAGSTQLAWARIHELVKNASCVRVPDTASPLVREELKRAGLEGASLLYADATEILFDPGSGALHVDGVRELGIRLSAAQFRLVDGEELSVILAADESAPAGLGRPSPVREQSAVAGRVFLRPQADAVRWHAFPVHPHEWCLGGDPLTYGVVLAER